MLRHAQDQMAEEINVLIQRRITEKQEQGTL